MNHSPVGMEKTLIVTLYAEWNPSFRISGVCKPTSTPSPPTAKEGESDDAARERQQRLRSGLELWHQQLDHLPNYDYNSVESFFFKMVVSYMST